MMADPPRRLPPTHAQRIASVVGSTGSHSGATRFARQVPDPVAPLTRTIRISSAAPPPPLGSCESPTAPIGQQCRQQFTVNVPVIVTEIELYSTNTSGAAGFGGIAADFANTGTIPWLGKCPVPAGAVGWNTYVLDLEVSLAPGTVYTVVASGVGNIGTMSTPVLTGCVATVGTLVYDDTFSSVFPAPWAMAFRLNGRPT